MSTTVLDTAVIGAGAAGLFVGKQLADRGIHFEMFDERARVGDTWRERYRSLRLFSPRPFLSLPGLRPRRPPARPSPAAPLGPAVARQELVISADAAAVRPP